MWKTYLTAILILFGASGLTAIENHSSGARTFALSNAVVSISDTWSTFHNQATLTGISTFTAGVYYESRFLTEELSLAAGTLVLPIKSGVFGFSYSQFGKGTYKENKTGLAFAMMLSEKLGASVQFDYFALRMPENENALGFVTFETGLVYHLNKNLHFGAHLFNPVKAGFETSEGKQEMPFTLRLGTHYSFPGNVLISFEAGKTGDYKWVCRSGLEFEPVKNFILRAGVSGRPINITTGIGFRTGKIISDIGFGYHANLGITPAVSIQFEL
jgi:hypothetical protein